MSQERPNEAVSSFLTIIYTRVSNNHKDCMDESQRKIIETGLDMQKSMMQLGISMYTPDFACKLLAYTLCFGGANEAVVQNPKLHFAIRACAELLNIKGGEIPDAELMPILQQRINELGHGGSKVEWLKEITDRYGVKIPETGQMKEYQRGIDLSAIRNMADKKSY